MALRWQARAYGALYEPGGLLDQPRRLMVTANACERVYEVWKAYQGVEIGRTVEWLTANPESARVVDYVMGLRDRYGE